jgi:hypothetical protein
MTMAKSRSILH